MNRVNSGAASRVAAQSLLLLAVIAGCKPVATNTVAIPTVPSSAEVQAAPADDWQWLFNGESTNSWTDSNGNEIGQQWQIIDNALVLTAADGGAIVSKQSFTDFELELAWQIAASGNSGIFYKVAGPDSEVR